MAHGTDDQPLVEAAKSRPRLNSADDSSLNENLIEIGTVSDDLPISDSAIDESVSNVFWEELRGKYLREDTLMDHPHSPKKQRILKKDCTVERKMYLEHLGKVRLAHEIMMKLQKNQIMGKAREMLRVKFNEFKVVLEAETRNIFLQNEETRKTVFEQNEKIHKMNQIMIRQEKMISSYRTILGQISSQQREIQINKLVPDLLDSSGLEEIVPKHATESEREEHERRTRKYLSEGWRLATPQTIFEQQPFSFYGQYVNMSMMDRAQVMHDYVKSEERYEREQLESKIGIRVNEVKNYQQVVKLQDQKEKRLMIEKEQVKKLVEGNFLEKCKEADKLAIEVDTLKERIREQKKQFSDQLKNMNGMTSTELNVHRSIQEQQASKIERLKAELRKVKTILRTPYLYTKYRNQDYNGMKDVADDSLVPDPRIKRSRR